MADTPRTWQILEVLKARLASITIANGYRTDAGLDVRDEASETLPTAPFIVVALAHNVRPDTGRHPTERVPTYVVEVHVPTNILDAYRYQHDSAADIEQALDTYLQLPNALPLEFAECVFLSRPEGLPVVVTQTTLTSRYRR